MISQNELLTDDDELKRLPYRSGKEKGIYVKSKLHQMPVFTQPSIFYNCHSTGQNLSHCICHSVESCVWKKAYRQHTRTITYPLKSLLCSILCIKISVFKYPFSFRRHHYFQTVLNVHSNAYNLRAGTCSSNLTCVPSLCESWITIQRQNPR